MNKANSFIFKRIFIISIIVCITQYFLKNSYAVEPDEVLQNQEYESRARNISKNIRCVVCQNQSIDESNAPLAKDFRILIRKKIIEGNSDKEIYKFLTARYGDFILLKPSVNLNTIGLWFLPFIFLILGIYIVLYHNKKS